ncbi:hypothetical protein LQF63_09310 [Tetragenococcus koreensis]|uniref:hypothetical protein n=1 Tax=Tetragenococcus koreensis TaxID=290335 RepID=UPI001F3221FA|nr:hypothetical protein [Tetragenococcus koreensis]MCF1617830.1 hypothetical protein [Tetragenococcus koreensis]
MNKNINQIHLTQAEKENSINVILKEIKLQPVTFRGFLCSYFQKVGLSYLFWGIGDILFLVGLLLVGGGLVYLPNLNHLLANNLTDEIYFSVFIFSPLCYALLYFLGIWKEILLGTFELKMTLRVSLKELLILRMLAFSIISLVILTGSNYLIWQFLGQEISLVRLFSLSFSSLFLFANLQLLLEYKIPLRRSYWVTPLIWLVVGAFFIWKQDIITQFLLYLPLTIVTTIVCGSFILFICLLRYNYFTEKEGTITYASA